MALINTDEGAKRLARVILSDIELYSRERPRAGETLESQIEEGRRLFGSRVAPALVPLFAVVLSDRRAAQKQGPAAPAEPRATPAPEIAASESSARHDAITAVDDPAGARTPSPNFSAIDSNASRPLGPELAGQPPPPPSSPASGRGVAVDAPPTPAPVTPAPATAADVTPRPAARPSREPPRRVRTTTAATHRAPEVAAFAPAPAPVPARPLSSTSFTPATPMRSMSFAPTPANPMRSTSFAPTPANPMRSTSFAPTPVAPLGSAPFATVARFGAPPQFSTAAPEVPVPVLTARISIPRLLALVAVAAAAVAALLHILS